MEKIDYFALQRVELEKTHKRAPWVDFSGQPIFEGDIIQHPSGQQGKVIFLPHEKDAADQWRVDYFNEKYVSRLCLQIGDKCRAKVIGRGLEGVELNVTVNE